MAPRRSKEALMKVLALKSICILLLGYFLLRALEAKNDAVKTLLFESDPFCKMKVDVLCTYWHFVDGLWVYLYLFFVVNIYVFTKGNFHSIF